MLIAGLAFERLPTAIPFGGVPIRVPIPPRLAAKAMARPRPALNLLSFDGSEAMIGATSANIIAVVAVLDMNIENNAVAIIIMIMNGFGLPLDLETKNLEIVLSKPYFSIATAIMNPPKKIRMIGLTNGVMNIVHCLGLVAKTPSGLPKIKTFMPAISIAVANAGRVSVNHKMAPVKKIKAVILPAGDRNSLSGNKRLANHAKMKMSTSLAILCESSLDVSMFLIKIFSF